MDNATANTPTAEPQDASLAMSTVAVGDEETSSLAYHDWRALIPSILSDRGLTCTEQTMESAASLLEQGWLGNFTQASSLLSTQVEASLMESFIEDDYDGALHLTTLDDEQGKPVGFVFWRQVPEDEMKDWIHWENLQKKLRGEQQQQLKQAQPDKEDQEVPVEDGLSSLPNHSKRRRMRQSIQMVRGESIRWLEVASSDAARRNSLLRSSTAPLERLTHSWVKIELLAVHPDHFKRHIGTLLMACAMYRAYQKGDDHMILHVAGGHENVPALRLYEKFGFLPVPQGTVFHKPDKDLFVLGHVGESLQRLCWPALEV
ncbi:expressed unknown protein [Seminavis robusta]|uniref:N-acetyltransferase domain-containing protein n=1 Tax=Seminavis robusta TaxID=568900 RepID=A0A9N8DKK9_9STRA|nr:expressed unknown protein [Seminavis robusta]|eukprot:Sro136_g064180.1 n/a (317) ;mRNA; r:73586-74536